MPTAQITKSTNIGGISFSSIVSRTADSANGYEITLPVGKAGTLTTRTDADTGEATLGSGHGITDGMVVDVYWADGARYGMTVGTVASLVVPIDGGSGDDLPSTSTALVVTGQLTANVNIDGDEAELVAVKLEVATDPTSTQRGYVSFRDVGDAEIEALPLTASDVQLFDIGGGGTNVFTGNPITYVLATNSSSTVEATLKIGVLQDSTP
jgi:hypothetical protein